MMYYHSTRSKNDRFTSKQAILKGICSDGGLFVSDDILNAHVDINGLADSTYEEIAYRVFRVLIPDYTDEELKSCIGNAYVGKFETQELTPVTEIGDKYLLELYHGPTSAFKDMALCMLPQFMSKALSGTDKKIMILTATSGDTGKAALAGFANAENIGITVFYPHGKVSDIQRLQMATQEGNNVFVAAVNGNFDDCQTGVKKIFREFSDESMKEYGVELSSANSINVGRLVPQVVYYYESYRQLLKKGVIKEGDKISFCVPTGNFGDVLAGYYAKLLGLPIDRLLVASNENNVLFDFIRTGIYDKNREFVKTISPSMDILVSSNLERFLYYASGCDCDYVKELMEELSTTGKFTVNEKVLKNLQETFDCGFITNEDSKDAIKEAYNKDGRLIDPHTAVAYRCAEKIDGTVVILSTASPFKFAADVYNAIFDDLSDADGFTYMEKLSEKTGEEAPEPLKSLREKEIIHKSVVDIDDMKAFAEESIKKAF
ncbi:MAG: threonine synthase [Lachnospiraceae bacterium]|nr:threonine synthase [Lachnospiraceae bacterium]